MRPMILAACATLMLAACSQQYTRYDSRSGDALPDYRFAPDPENRLVAGFAAIETGDFAAAEAPLMQRLTVEPDDPYALLAMGVVMEQTDRVDEAISYYRGAALNGDTAPVGATATVDGTIAPTSRTIRDLALFNIARLK